MDINVISGDITKVKADAMVLYYFEGATRPEGALASVDEALGGGINQLINQGEIKGKLNEITLVHTFGKLAAPRMAVVGLGKAQDLTADKVRGAIAEACRALRARNVSSVTTMVLSSNAIGAQAGAQALAEGAVLGTYTFRKHITREPEHGEIKLLSIVEPDDSKLSELEKGAHKGRILAEAANFTRDMINEPANFHPPVRIAEIATELAGKYGLEITIFDREQMQQMGMGGLLGVAQGSQQPPKFIVMRYKGTDSARIDVALVGKGITFDSGGISLKPAENMGEMKGDMAGGASVMLALSAIAQLKPGLNVMAVIPATENLPSGTALKPGDVLTAMNGKTIEVITTDAEGRLILSDALSYANKMGARCIIDVATLTGACVVALGKICTGAFGNNQELIDSVIAAGKEAGEPIWQLPMFPEYKEQNKSDVADVKNSGGRDAGAITAAQFLAEFAGETPWVHLDIAGTSMSDKERNYTIKGATGVPVRTLVNFVMSRAGA